MNTIKNVLGRKFKNIRSRDNNEVGKFTGSTKRCTLEGCSGVRFAVRWNDGKLTWPCSDGIISDRKGLKIR